MNTLNIIGSKQHRTGSGRRVARLKRGGYSGILKRGRFGEAARPYTGSSNTRALFNARADGERAIRRAKRWLANKSTGPLDTPPRHIYANAELAAAQFPDLR